MAQPSLKAAPRRPVRDVHRHGDWGDVTYHHHLACGHVEVRKRRSPTGTLACSGCLTAQRFAAGDLTRPTRRVAPTPDDPSVDVAVMELRAALARRFEVPPDAVDVAFRAGAGVAYVLVFLERDVALHLAGLDTNSSTL